MQLNRFPDKEQFGQLAKDFNVIPLCVKILADTETPVSLFKNIYKNIGPVFLFESVEGGERWGRYSFMGVSASRHIRIYRDFIAMEDNGLVEKVLHHHQPLNVLRNYMKRFKPACIAGLPRFWGGLVGYMTYEMVSFFESIPNRLSENSPLAHFILPDKLLIFDNVHHTLLCIVISFADGEKDAAEAYKKANFRMESMLEEIKMNPGKSLKKFDSFCAEDYQLTAQLKRISFALRSIR